MAEKKAVEEKVAEEKVAEKKAAEKKAAEKKAAKEKAVKEATITIKAKVDNDQTYWRGGKQHTREFKDHSVSDFTQEQLKSLKNDPRIEIQA